MELQVPLHPQHLIELAKYATVAVAVIATGGAIVASIAFYRAQRDHAKTFGLLVQRVGVLQLGTILAIVVALGFLVAIYSISLENIIAINK